MNRIATILWMSDKNFDGLLATIACSAVAYAWIGFLFDWDIRGMRQAGREELRSDPALNGTGNHRKSRKG